MLLAPQKDELIGQILNERYKVVAEVGRGGMSAVYKGIHELMDRIVAIKVLLPQLVSDQISIKRFQQEAQAASHLQHPNVITVYDYGFVANGQPYLVMDFLEGESLSDIIKRDKQVHTKRMIPIFMQACEALEHAHQKGVIHRDLKSSNIMLIDFEGKKDFVKVVDFGIAKLMPSSGKQSQNLTQTGEVFGSPIYMSPEQCMAQSLDARSDIYSMGAMMYEALTGQPPLMGNSIIDTMQMHMSTPPKPFKEVRPELDIPDSLERVVLKALAKKPEQRYQSMQELRDALEGVSKLMDQEKLFGPGAPGRSPRSTRARLNQLQAKNTQTAPQTRTKSSIDPNDRTRESVVQDAATREITGKEPVGSSTSRREAPPPAAKKTAEPPKPEAKDKDKKIPIKFDLEKLKQVKLFNTVPLLWVAGSVVGSILTVGIVVGVMNSPLPKWFTSESTIEGMVYYYAKPEKKDGQLFLYKSPQDDEEKGKFYKLVVPPDLNLDDYAAMAEGIGIGDTWQVKFHRSGDQMIVDKGEFLDKKQTDGEDLRQVYNHVRNLFALMTATENNIQMDEVCNLFTQDWRLDNYKKLKDSLLAKDGVEWRLVADPNAVPKAFTKVETFDRDQRKATILVKTKYWIKKGPLYLRFSLIKKDDKIWLISNLEEVSPKIWREDGVKQEELDAGGDEGEGTETEGAKDAETEDVGAGDEVGEE